MRKLVLLVLLLYMSLASTALATPESKLGPSIVPQAEVIAMEQEQAMHSSKYGGGLIPRGAGTVDHDGQTWEVLSEVRGFVPQADKGKGDVGALGGCGVESYLTVQTHQLAGVRINEPECSGGLRVKKVEVKWFKQSLLARGKPVIEAKSWQDSCWWHCSGSYLVPSHRITAAQQVWPQVTWTFSDGSRLSHSHIKWAFNSAAYPYPRVKDTRALYGEAWLPFRIPTMGWAVCEDDATKTPTCARTWNFRQAVEQWYTNNRVPFPNCSDDPLGAGYEAHHVTPVSKGGGNQMFLDDGQGALLCQSDHDKIHYDPDQSGNWFALLIPTDSI